MAKWRHPAEFNLTFAQRLLAVADWLDILDARLDHQYGSDDVQRDFRRVARGLAEDPTLDDLMTDLLREFPEDPAYMDAVRIAGPLSEDLVGISEPGVLHVTISTKIDGKPTTHHRVLDPVHVMSGDTFTVNYTLNIA
jgi:hypothetical protein